MEGLFDDGLGDAIGWGREDRVPELHDALMSRAPLERIEAILRKGDLTTTTALYGEMTPLLRALRMDPIDVGVVFAIIEKNPRAILLGDADKKRTPLHELLKNYSNTDPRIVDAVVDVILAKHPEAAAEPDAFGCLPLHCINKNTPFHSIKAVYKAYPAGATVSNRKQETPLHKLYQHVAIGGVVPKGAADLFKLLGSNPHQQDEAKKSPFDVLLDGCQNFSRDLRETVDVLGSWEKKTPVDRTPERMKKMMEIRDTIRSLNNSVEELLGQEATYEFERHAEGGGAGQTTTDARQIQEAFIDSGRDALSLTGGSGEQDKTPNAGPPVGTDLLASNMVSFPPSFPSGGQVTAESTSLGTKSFEEMMLDAYSVSGTTAPAKPVGGAGQTTHGVPQADQDVQEIQKIIASDAMSLGSGGPAKATNNGLGGETASMGTNLLSSDIASLGTFPQSVSSDDQVKAAPAGLLPEGEVATTGSRFASDMSLDAWTVFSRGPGMAGPSGVDPHPGVGGIPVPLVATNRNPMEGHEEAEQRLQQGRFAANSSHGRPIPPEPAIAQSNAQSTPMKANPKKSNKPAPVPNDADTRVELYRGLIKQAKSLSARMVLAKEFCESGHGANPKTHVRRDKNRWVKVVTCMKECCGGSITAYCDAQKKGMIDLTRTVCPKGIHKSKTQSPA